MKNLLLILFIVIVSVPIYSQIPNSNAGEDTYFCGHSGNLHATLTDGTGIWSSTLPEHVTITDPSDPETEVYCDILTSGNPTYPYINFIWTVTLGEETDSDTVRIQFIRIPSSEIDIIPAKCFGESFTIAASEDSLSSYQWNFYDGMIDETFTNAFNGDFQNFVHWEGTDTAHIISLIATNYWGCQSPVNIDTVYEPIIPTFEEHIFPDTCLLGKGAIVFADTLGTSQYFWINEGVGTEYGTSFTRINNLPAGIYDVEISYLTPNIIYYAYYIATFGTANCLDTATYEIVFDIIPDANAFVSQDIQLNNLYAPASVVFVKPDGNFDFETTCIWNYGDGASEEICDELVEHIYQTAGCFSPYLVIEFPTIEGCRDTAYIEPCINVQSNESVSQNDLHTQFKVYPNPTTNWLTIESETLQIKTIRIIDITGKELVNIENFDNEKVDISNLNSGYYRIIINSDGGEYNLPLIKQ